MNSIQLSKNFWFEEFSFRDHHILSNIQMEMVMNLALLILQPIRDFLCIYFKKDIAITIRSGIRFPSDVNRLRQAGYNPSETSDHLFGNVIKLNSLENIRKYGKYHTYSVGAVDIVPMCGAKEAWDILRSKFKIGQGIISLPSGDVKIGQCILEKRNSYWIHIANPASLIYSLSVANAFLRKPDFLVSDDNGKTYKPIS